MGKQGNAMSENTKRQTTLHFIQIFHGFYVIYARIERLMSRDSVVGIATGHGLDLLSNG
jgi:hypothetical protein